MSTATLDQTTIDTTAQQQAATILKKSVVLVMTTKIFGNTRKVEVQDLVDAATSGEAHAAMSVDAAQFSSVKRLIDQKELRGCYRVIGGAKSYLQSIAIPAHRVFGDRSYLIPRAVVAQADERMQEFQRELADESAALALRFADAVERQREKLGKLFKEGEYPTVTQVAESFTLDYAYVSFSAPENLEEVSPALARRAADEYTARLSTMFDETKLLLRTTLQHVVKELERKLKSGNDGKPKTFRNSVLDDLAGFLETFPFRNMIGDAELEAVATRLHRLTEGLSPEDLREQDLVRDHVLAGLTEAASELDDLVVPLRRQITLPGR